MNMEDIKFILPAIPEDYDSQYEIDGKWFPDLQKYKLLMKVLYVKTEPRKLLNLKISRVEKKRFLLNLLQLQKDILNSDFINKLKQILPDGLCYENICTDAEYELLKKEFDIE